MANQAITSDPGGLDIGVYQGDDFSLALLLQSGSPVAAIDLTGGTFRAQIRQASNNNQLTAFTCTVADQTVVANKGIVVISLTGTQTAALTTTDGTAATALLYDLEGTVGGKVRTYVKGAILVTPQVTA